MSKYTTEVRYICEKSAGYDESKGFNDVDAIIDAAIPNVFNFDFPIFDENYRNVICTKILRHYYTREIGYETVGIWKLKLYTKLNEIMPFYNQLYESELLKFNPLYDVDLKTTHVGSKDSENVSNKSENENRKTSGANVVGENRKGNSASDESNSNVVNAVNNESGVNEGTNVKGKDFNDNESATHYDLYSDTPQGALNGVEDEEYLTNARKITDSKNRNGKENESDIKNEKYNKNNRGESTEVGVGNSNTEFNESNERTAINNENVENNRSVNGSDKFTSAESYILHVSGKQAGASYSKLLKEFRETFLNIDMEVINNLSDLFMNLW